jgi:hypothetical protein
MFGLVSAGSAGWRYGSRERSEGDRCSLLCHWRHSAACGSAASDYEAAFEVIGLEGRGRYGGRSWPVDGSTIIHRAGRDCSVHGG